VKEIALISRIFKIFDTSWRHFDTSWRHFWSNFV